MLLLAGAWPAIAETVPEGRIRIGRHPDHLRIVLEGPAAPQLVTRADATEISIDGAAVWREAELARLAAAGTPVRGIRQAPERLVIATMPADAKIFRLPPDRLVIDLRPRALEPAEPAPLAAASLAPPATAQRNVPTTPPLEASPLVEPWPSALPPTTLARLRRALPLSDEAWPDDPTPGGAAAALPRAVAPDAAEVDVLAALAAPDRAPSPLLGPTDVAGVGVGDDPAATGTDLRADDRHAPWPLRLEHDPAALRITTLPAPPVALFRRGPDWLLVIDDVLERIDGALAALAVDPAAPPLRRLPHPDATILALPVELAPQPGLERLADGWRLRLDDPTPRSPALALPLPTGDRLALEAEAAPVRIADPTVGDPLWVVPRLEVGATAGLDLVDLELLPTRHGIAWRPRSDGLVQRREPGRLVLALPSRAAAPPPAVVAAAAPAATGPLCPTLARHEPGRERLRRAQAALAEGFGAEALAILEAAPSSERSGRCRAELIAAAHLLNGHPALAAQRFADPAGTSGEHELWHHVAGALAGPPPADPPSTAARAALRGYPPPLRRRLIPPLAMTAAAAGRFGEVLDLLTGLDLTALSGAERGRAALLEARALAGLGQRGPATAAAERALAEGDPPTRAGARFLLVEIARARGELDAAAALAALSEQARDWRDHPQEAAMRRAAAEAARLAERPAAGLRLLGPILASDPAAQELASELLVLTLDDADLDPITKLQQLRLAVELDLTSSSLAPRLDRLAAELRGLGLERAAASIVPMADAEVATASAPETAPSPADETVPFEGLEPAAQHGVAAPGPAAAPVPPSPAAALAAAAEAAAAARALLAARDDPGAVEAPR